MNSVGYANRIAKRAAAQPPAFTWLQTPDIFGSAAKDKAAAVQVVIVSNFVGH